MRLVCRLVAGVALGVAAAPPAIAGGILASSGLVLDSRTAQGARAIEAVRLDPHERIRLDGRLEEAAWRRAVPAGDFRQQEPDEGQPSTEPTEVRVLYDSENLYIGALMRDSNPAGIIGRQRQRDASTASDDRFVWVLDTFRDGRTGYFFEVNPAGLMGDGLMRGGAGGVNRSWDGIWEARVLRHAEGWSAEIRIPFRTLNFDPSADAWGINFQRTIRRKNEESFWSGYARNQGLLRLTHAGRLTGLRELSQGVGLEVKPYVVGSSEAAPMRGAAATSAADLGVDINYSLTPGLRASLTVNTDFAEAEVDQRRVNLTRFPLVFPERRDFFLEGSGVFGFAQSSGPSPYYSRRIGLIGGHAMPVRAGGRLTGQAGPYELGFLHVNTGSGDLAAAGTTPGEAFTVARVKRSIFVQSTLGAVYTRRARSGGSDAALRLPEGHTAGVDLDLFTSRFRGNRNLQFESFLVWHTDPFGSPATSFGDRSARGVRLAYPNDVWAMHISAREFGASYDPPVGLVTRRGFRRIQPTVGYSPRPQRWDRVRQLDFRWQVTHLTDLRGRLETFEHAWTLFGARLASGDGFEVAARRSFERLDVPFRIFRRAAGDGSDDVVIPAGDHTAWSWEVSGRTAGQRAVSLSSALQGGQFWSGTRLQGRVLLDVRPFAGLELGTEYERNDVRLPQGAFVTNLVRIGSGWHVSPRMSLTGNLQYDDVSRVVGTFTRFRWIVRPGSDVYLVYTHNLLADPTSLDRARWLETIERKAATKVTFTHRF
jgi:hypothetical protein